MGIALMFRKRNPVVRAELRIAADNAFKVWLDGQELAAAAIGGP